MKARKRRSPGSTVLTVTVGTYVVAECYAETDSLMFEDRGLDTEVATVIEYGSGPERVGVYFIRRG